MTQVARSRPACLTSSSITSISLRKRLRILVCCFDTRSWPTPGPACSARSSGSRRARKIETALNETAPGANQWPSSPSPGYMNFGDAWHDDSSGGDIFTPKPLKAYDLLAPGIWTEFAQDGDIWRITLSAEKPAFSEAIEADVPGGSRTMHSRCFPDRPPK
jgi:hypothetical protein